MVPIISEWQVESPTKDLGRVETSKVAVDVNVWLANFLDQLQSCNLSLTQVYKTLSCFQGLFQHFCQGEGQMQSTNHVFNNEW